MTLGETVRTRPLPGDRRLELVHGNLVTEEVDAIVNAANEHLQHGGGVAGAIARAGGASIQEESDRIGRVETGSAAITGAGSLPCRFVIHAVGPIWRGGDSEEPEQLAAAVSAALKLAEQHQLQSLALPAISTGIYGFPKAAGARIIIDTISRHFDEAPSSPLRRIRITLIDEESVAIFRGEMERADEEGATD